MQSNIFVLKVGTYKSQLSKIKHFNDSFKVIGFEEIKTIGFENGYIRDILGFIGSMKNLIYNFEKQYGKINQKVFLTMSADYIKVDVITPELNSEINIINEINEISNIFQQDVIFSVKKKYQDKVSNIYIDKLNKVALVNLIQSINNAGLKIEKLIPLDYFESSNVKFQTNAYIHLSDDGVRISVMQNNILILKVFIKYSFDHLSRNFLLNKFDIHKAIYHEINMADKVNHAFFQDIHKIALITKNILKDIKIDNLILLGTVLNDDDCKKRFQDVFSNINVSKINENKNYYDWSKCLNKSTIENKAPYLIGLMNFLYCNKLIQQNSSIINRIKMIFFMFLS